LRSPPPLWLLGATLVLGETVCVLAGWRSIGLSALALVAPGWALAPLLPEPVRRSPLATIVAAPVLGIAVVSALLITLARVGIPLTDSSVHIALIALIALASFAWGPAGGGRVVVTRADLLEAAALLAVLVLAFVLALQVVGGTLMPGNDWAKYLLYGDQVSLRGALLIKNPYWLLGVPFRDDPGVPSLYGAVLLMSHARAGALNHGILVFAMLEIGAVFAFARAFWGRAAGVLAAALIAVVPASQDILGWEGVANLSALVLLALLMSYLAAYARGGLDAGAKVGLALTLIGLLASHRLSGLMGVAMTALVFLLCLALRRDRARTLRDGVQVALVGLIAGAGVLADIYAREKTFGGSLPYTDYLGTKINLTLAVRDLSPELTVAAILALAVIALRHRDDRALWPPLALLAISVVLAYVWLIDVPNYYSRMVFYVPLVAAPIVAAVLVRLRWPILAGAAALAVTVVVAVGAFNQAPSVRNYYSFVTPAALRGLDALTAVLRPGEPVVTDRCWSFLATWLLSTRTLAALAPEDIQPKAEYRLTLEAHDILNWNAAGRRLARRLGVRYLITDPTCPAPNGSLLGPPRQARAVFESDRLAILVLPSGSGTKARRRPS
jgi:hypothetical protein